MTLLAVGAAGGRGHEFLLGKGGGTNVSAIPRRLRRVMLFILQAGRLAEGVERRHPSVLPRWFHRSDSRRRAASRRRSGCCGPRRGRRGLEQREPRSPTRRRRSGQRPTPRRWRRTGPARSARERRRARREERQASPTPRLPPRRPRPGTSLARGCDRSERQSGPHHVTSTDHRASTQDLGRHSPGLRALGSIRQTGAGE